MSDHDIRNMRKMLHQVINAAGLADRQVEDAMGLGHGRLGRLFDGSMEIKLRHLLGLARRLKISPGELVAMGSPETEQLKERRVADWLGISEPKAQRVETPPNDLDERIRRAVREELLAAAAERKD
jgi:transcriptional regulator with XRE-family HTH domain